MVEIPNNTKHVPADYFPPGEYIADELRERGISHELFAKYLGLTDEQFADLVAGKRFLFLSTACKVATFFGTDPVTWMNLERIWRSRPKDYVYVPPEPT